jgi:succinoglycan biosynthesis transport protein ExoP
MDMNTEIREETIDLRDYLRVLSMRRWVIISIFIVTVLTVAVKTFTATPIYEASSLIVIERQNPNVISIQEVLSGNSNNWEYYQTQYKIIASRVVAREVIKQLDLANSPEFFSPPDDSVLTQFRGWVKSLITGPIKWFRSLINTGINTGDADQGQDLNAGEAMDQDQGLVSAFLGRVNVSPIRDSQLVNVGVQAKDPVMAARMANELVKAYIGQNLGTKLTAAKDAVQWLSKRISEERTKVEAAENALLSYKEKHQIITDFSSDAEQITAQKLATLNEQVVKAESMRVEAETRYQQALALDDTPDMLDSISEVLSNDLVKEIKRMEVVLYNRMSELSRKYGKNHPQMVAINSELEDLKKRKAVEARRVVSSLKNEYQLAVAREESLKKALARQKQETLALNKKAVQFGVLKRQAESSRQLYELLVKRFKETSLTEEMKTGNIRVIDRAEVPGYPVKPRKKRNILLAVVVGLFFGIGMAFLLEYLDNTIKLPEEVTDFLRVPYLGPVPAFSMDGSLNEMPSRLISVHSPKSTASEAYRGLRTSLLLSSADTKLKVIMVVGAGPFEGKTLTSANLAVTMAQSHQRVLLIDADMRRPDLHKIFQTPHNKGLSSILAGTDTPEDAIVETSVEGLELLPVGPIPPNPAELIGSKTMERFIAGLKEKYEIIIIDTPPLTAVTDAVALSQYVDGVMLVSRTGITPRRVVKNSIEQLKAVNANILGVVLNGVGKDRYYYSPYYYGYYGEDDDKKKKSGKIKQPKGDSALG